jgi:hypothetical protein
MLTTIASIVVTFIFTGVIGNLLLQKWQHRTWVNQQQFLGEEKHYFALTALWEELMNLASRRLWRMRRLLFAVDDGDNAKIQQRLSEYDAVLSEWNEKFHSISVRLTLYASRHLNEQLEHELQRSFLIAGMHLEQLAKARRVTGSIDRKLVAEVRRQLNGLSAQISRFNLATLEAVHEQRVRTYYGVEVEFSREHLDQFGTWELLKALFKPGIEPLRVFRPPANVGTPSRSGL